MNSEYRKAIDRFCRNTYIKPRYKGDRIVKLEHKGKDLTEWITLEQAYMLMSALKKVKLIGAVVYNK